MIKVHVRADTGHMRDNMGSCEWVIMGLESQAVSARATKHFVTIFSKYV